MIDVDSHAFDVTHRMFRHRLHVDGCGGCESIREGERLNRMIDRMSRVSEAVLHTDRLRIGRVLSTRVGAISGR